MPCADSDCKFRDEWLVQDKYKEWMVKDGETILARCQFCMEIFHTRNANSRMNSEKVGVGPCACIMHVI